MGETQMGIAVTGLSLGSGSFGFISIRPRILQN